VEPIQQPSAAPDAAREAASLLEWVEAIAARGSYREAALWLTSELARRTGCERVSLGFERRGRIRVEALSHHAQLDPRSALARALAEAMHEACDQDAVIQLPAPRGAAAHVTRAHGQLARDHGAVSICTIPLAWRGRAVGALTFERREATLAPEAVAPLARLAMLVGPLLALQRRVDSGPPERLRAWLHEGVGSLLAPGHLRAKLVVSGAIAAMLLTAALPATHRVKADATLEGLVQRAIVAGVDGYVAEAGARAGDVVAGGQMLARLDDRDLELERKRWRARVSELRREYRSAMAQHDRTERSLVQARLEEARAQVALLDEQLARTRLVAPFDGVVVRGDLSQSLGAPVERGDVLFEIAPVGGYRIILEVDERDIAYVGPGRRGALALAALPGSPLALEVEQVTPVSVAEGGRNYFRVEARLDEPHPGLRPGMEGVARIDVGRRQVAWIWTHELVDWLRLQAWSWLP
jgi:biotin carboxyl carrier protein